MLTYTGLEPAPAPTLTLPICEAAGQLGLATCAAPVPAAVGIEPRAASEQ